MGYTTYFSGQFEFDKPVEPWLIEYVEKFCQSRRMKRDNEKIKELYPKWKDLCFNGELGVEGEFFVGGIGFYGQTDEDSVIDHNRPPCTQPGLWCQWVITDDGKYLEWDGGEKFYEYVDWLVYMIGNFFAPLGYKLNGEVTFDGEDYDDIGVIYVKDNFVEVEYGVHCHSISSMDDKTLIDELIKRGYTVTGKNYTEQ